MIDGFGIDPMSCNALNIKNVNLTLLQTENKQFIYVFTFELHVKKLLFDLKA
jgi:hypothetical protein